MAELTSGDGANEMAEKPGTSAQEILAAYLTALKSVRASGAGVDETSYYPALANLFDAVGKTLKPRVRCVMNLRNLGAGMPDGGLFTPDQFQRQADDTPRTGQLPARGAIEAKGTKPEIADIVKRPQVIGDNTTPGYLSTYGIVLVTNLREFRILERGPNGQPVERESFALATDENDFWSRAVAHPRGTDRSGWWPSTGLYSTGQALSESERRRGLVERRRRRILPDIELVSGGGCFLYLHLGYPLVFFGTACGCFTVAGFRRARRKAGCCARCGYDLRGSPSGTCSECGAKQACPAEPNIV